MKKYRKSIALHYNYVESIEGKEALARIFDDIFKRLMVKKKNNYVPRSNSILTIV